VVSQAKKDGAAGRHRICDYGGFGDYGVIALARTRAVPAEAAGKYRWGVTRAETCVWRRDLQAVGAMMGSADRSASANLVQTIEGVPAFVSRRAVWKYRPRTCSVISQEMGFALADLRVTNAAFAADLGAEKYIDIVYRSTGVSPFGGGAGDYSAEHAQPG